MDFLFFLPDCDFVKARLATLPLRLRPEAALLNDSQSLSPGTFKFKRSSVNPSFLAKESGERKGLNRLLVHLDPLSLGDVGVRRSILEAFGDDTVDESDGSSREDDKDERPGLGDGSVL